MTNRYLLDTNILTRLSFSQASDHSVTVSTLDKLTDTGHQLCIAAQCLIEFRVVATRPKDQNGYGLTAEQATSEIAILESGFDLLPDNGDVYPKWRELVIAGKTLGKSNHDARLLAFAIVNECSAVLTFNVTDFARYINLSSPVVVVSPVNV